MIFFSFKKAAKQPICSFSCCKCFLCLGFHQEIGFCHQSVALHMRLQTVSTPTADLTLYIC